MLVKLWASTAANFTDVLPERSCQLQSCCWRIWTSHKEPMGTKIVYKIWPSSKWLVTDIWKKNKIAFHRNKCKCKRRYPLLSPLCYVHTAPEYSCKPCLWWSQTQSDSSLIPRPTHSLSANHMMHITLKTWKDIKQVLTQLGVVTELLI